jgi:uncharacterized protein (DUF58 family)
MEQRFSSQPAGFLLSRLGLLALLAGLVVATWYGQVVIAVLLGLALSAAGLSKLWSRLSLAGVSCQRRLNEYRAFPGEYIESTLRVVNRKLLPLPWLQVDDEIPIGFAPDISLEQGSRPGFGLLSRATALLWYTGVSWRHRLYCSKRGYYPLGPLVVSSGDILGLYPRSITEPSVDHVIVYPKIFPIEQLGIPSLQPVGETTAKQRIFEDPSRVIGVRDYSPRDSRRRIHWKATARHQSLQVKVFEPTTTLKIALFLAVDSFKHGEIYSEEDFELGISIAASIANHVIEQGNQVGVHINTCLVDSGQPVRILPGSSTGQLVEILEALAKVTPRVSSPSDEFLESERIGLPWGTTFVFILSRPIQSLAELLTGMKESGHKLLVLQVGEVETSGIEQTIAWHNVGQPGEFMLINSKETR